MSRPGNEAPNPVKPPAKPVPQPAGGIDPTLAATGVFKSGIHAPSDPALQATMAFTPTEFSSAANDATLEVTNLAFPRAHVGTDPGATVVMDRTLPPRRAQYPSDLDTSPTLDSDGKTNAFSMSSLDGSAEIVLNDLPSVAGYKLVSELGRGGMGVVYKAFHVKLERLDALKMILAGVHASKDQLERFLSEARAIAHLTHQNIVKIHDVGERENLPFFSLEFVDGGSLQQTINGKPQPVDYAAKIVKLLCEAMAFAHSKNIIHRDLKPANVLMTKSGEPKITDFGLAKRLEGDSQQTRDGAVMGTPSYMAPEQAWGRTAEVGPLADQHALGAILYEMLTGRPPYQGATALDTLDQVRNQEPVPPTRLQPKVPNDLETICLKAIQKEAAKRYDSCQEMADDLGRFLEEKPILARPVGLPEQAWRWCKRNRNLAKAYAGVAALILASFIGAVVFAFIVAKKNAALIIAKAKTDASVSEARALATAGVDLTDTMMENGRYLSILVNQRLKDLPGSLDIRREIFKVALLNMKRAEKDIERLRAQNVSNKETDAFTLRTKAGIHQREGSIYLEMGPRYADKVWPEFAEMKKLADQHYAMDPNELEAIKNMAATRLTLGDHSSRQKGDDVAAEAYYLEAVKFRRMWIERAKDDDIAKQALANALGRLAQLYQRTGRPKQAFPYYEEEEKVRFSVSPQQITDSEFRRETAGLEDMLGEIEVRLGHPQKALEHYERSLEERKDFVKDFPDHPQATRDVMLSLNALGNYYEVTKKDNVTARKFYEDALTIARTRLEADHNSYINRRDVFQTLYFLGTLLKSTGDQPQSDIVYNECLGVAKTLIREDVPIPRAGDETLQDYIRWMLALARCGKHEQAARIAKALVENPPSSGANLYQAACGYALAAGAVDRAEPDKKALAKTYRDNATSALRMARAKGWNSPEEVANDPDLEPLRPDPGFPALLEEFRNANK